MDGAAKPLTETLIEQLGGLRVVGGVAIEVGDRDVDVNLMLDAEKKAHVRWDIAAAIQPKLTRAVEMGLGTKDWSEGYEVTRTDADLVA